MWIWCVGGESVNEWVVSFLLLLPTPLVVVVGSAEGRGRGGVGGATGRLGGLMAALWKTYRDGYRAPALSRGPYRNPPGAPAGLCPTVGTL